MLQARRHTDASCGIGLHCEDPLTLGGRVGNRSPVRRWQMEHLLDFEEAEHQPASQVTARPWHGCVGVGRPAAGCGGADVRDVIGPR